MRDGINKHGGTGDDGREMKVKVEEMKDVGAGEGRKDVCSEGHEDN